jgi:hypothetical protein
MIEVTSTGSGMETSAHHSFSQRRDSRGPRELFRLDGKRQSKASSHPRVAQRNEAKQADEKHLPVEERSSGECEQIRASFYLRQRMYV